MKIAKKGATLTKASVLAEARRAGAVVKLDANAWKQMNKAQRHDILVLIKQLNVTGGQPPHRV